MNIILLIAMLLVPGLASAEQFVLDKAELVKLVNLAKTAEAQHRFCEQKVLLLVEAQDHQRKIIELERSDKEDLLKAVNALRDHNASADDILASIRSHVDALAQENEELRVKVRIYRWITGIESSALVVGGAVLLWLVW